ISRVVQNSRKLHVDEQQWRHTVKDWAAINLDEFKSRKEISNFESGGSRGVGAMGAIVADAGAQIVANGAGRGFLGIGGAHGVAPLQDGAFGFQNHGEDLAGTHEVGELAEEGALAMHGVEATGFFFGEAHGFDGDNFEAGFVNAGKDFALKITPDSIRFDDCKRAFDGHGKFLQNLNAPITMAV